MRPAKGEAVSEAVDPLRKFFDDLGHRIDQYPTLTPAGQAWPTLETFDLYSAWLRFNQQRRELRIREEQVKSLHAELKRRDRTAAEQECGPGRNVSDEPKLWSASRPCDRFATENDRKAFLGMFPGDKLDQFTPEFAAYVRTGELAEEQPQIPAWDIAALDQLSPADRIDYITDRLAADFKNKTTNVGVAILMLRNLAEEMREEQYVASAGERETIAPKGDRHA